MIKFIQLLSIVGGIFKSFIHANDCCHVIVVHMTIKDLESICSVPISVQTTVTGLHQY